MRERLQTLSQEQLCARGDKVYRAAHNLMRKIECNDPFGLDLNTFCIYYPRQGEVLRSYINEAKRRAQQKVMHS